MQYLPDDIIMKGLTLIIADLYVFGLRRLMNCGRNDCFSGVA